MPMLEERQSICPYCGEPLLFLIDTSCGDQEYTEDCQVCCRPIIISFQLDENAEIILFSVYREDE